MNEFDFKWVMALQNLGIIIFSDQSNYKTIWGLIENLDMA